MTDQSVSTVTEDRATVTRIGWRNLLHDPARASTAVAGVVVAVLLLVLQVGLLDGSSRNASGIIDHASADLWLVPPRTSTFDFGATLPERRFYQALSTPGVARAERMILAFGKWTAPDGCQQTVTTIGLEPDAELAGPWSLAAGNRDALRAEGAVIIDQRERVRFGPAGRPLALGDLLEISGRRVDIVAFSRGVGSFTTVPYVFASLPTARLLADFGPTSVTYVLVRAAPGTDIEALAGRLRALPDVEVLTARDFCYRTRRYWIFGTGMGLGLLVTAVLGLVVGTVVVGQTIYTMTLEKRAEYGTLKALGYSARDLAQIVLVQAAALGLVGYAIGIGLVFLLLPFVTTGGVAIRVAPELAAGSLVLTGILTFVASLASIARLVGMEPAVVFRQ